MKYLFGIFIIMLVCSCSDSNSPDPEKSIYVGSFEGNTTIWDWMFEEMGECSFSADDISGKPMITKLSVFWAYYHEIHDGIRKGRGYHTVEMSSGITEIKDDAFYYESNVPYTIKIEGNFATKDSIFGTYSGTFGSGDDFSGSFSAVRK